MPKKEKDRTGLEQEVTNPKQKTPGEEVKSPDTLKISACPRHENHIGGNNNRKDSKK